MNYLRLLLLPLTLIYSLIIFFRNKLYDKGIFKIYKVNTPVISVGNLTTGGTGKTPFVIFLAKYLLKKRKMVAIISRGFGRNNYEYKIIYDGNRILCSVEESGDELMMIVKELLTYSRNFIVGACGNRYIAATDIINKFRPDIIILDDAFQHRAFHRDIDFVVIDSNSEIKDTLGNKLLLPAGNLRENRNNLKRSHFIIQNNKQNNIPVIPFVQNSGKPFLTASYEVSGIYDINNKQVTLNQNNNIIAFAGLADNDSFSKTLETIFKKKIKLYKFSDHHKYSDKDLQFLEKLYTDSGVFLTTEKDIIKFEKYSIFTEKYPLYYVKIELKINENLSLLEDIILPYL